MKIFLKAFDYNQRVDVTVQLREDEQTVTWLVKTDEDRFEPKTVNRFEVYEPPPIITLPLRDLYLKDSENIEVHVLTWVSGVFNLKKRMKEGEETKDEKGLS